MSIRTLKQEIMLRDELTEEEADATIAEAKKELIDRIEEGEMPFEICEELFGLEPDFIFDLI